VAGGRYMKRSKGNRRPECLLGHRSTPIIRFPHGAPFEFCLEVGMTDPVILGQHAVLPLPQGFGFASMLSATHWSIRIDHVNQRAT
jgi:hypothetical protein